MTADILPDALASVWLITGDDELDDPAYDIGPIFTGNWKQVLDWLKLQRSIND